MECDKEGQNSDKQEATKNRRQKEEENPELFKKVLEEVIAKIK